MESEADAVIGNGILRKVVGANLFRAVTGFDLAATLGADGGLLLFELQFVQARAKDAHSLGAVFDLRLFVLLRNNQTAGDVRDAHRGIRGIHGLAAGTRGTERVDAQILRFDFDVNVVGFGKHGDGRRGRVDAPLLLGSGDALHAMYTAFVFQLGINFVALNRGN